MTYRKDSDVYFPYGKVIPISSDATQINLAHMRKHDAPNFLQEKTKLVAWTVSHCETQSHREVIVREMQKHLPVDVYGGCGNSTCPSDNKNSGSKRDVGCFAHIGKHYKFYLSFENSLCTEYVTEKFFIPLMSYVVPVVYGGANYSAIAPPGSFIDAWRFSSIKDLTDYLIFLDRNDEEYLKYFEWKNHFTVKYPSDTESWCDLCTKVSLHKAAGRKGVRQWYPNLKMWWNTLDSQYKPTRKLLSRKPKQLESSDTETLDQKINAILLSGDVLSCTMPKSYSDLKINVMDGSE
jgi:alpha-1,3-fucosyltransferase